MSHPPPNRVKDWDARKHPAALWCKLAARKEQSSSPHPCFNADSSRVLRNFRTLSFLRKTKPIINTERQVNRGRFSSIARRWRLRKQEIEEVTSYFDS